MRIIDEKTKEILKDSDARWTWIKYELMKMDETLSSVAKTHDSNPRTIQTAQKRTYPKVELWLAESLDMNPSDLFPERYDKHGLPIRGLSNAA